ncbi:phosphotransferase [Streptomyces afghaniensis]|uniref:phosphotransferase n=1 Tax=Streptomyces afghaniensis TaxID=66865 RepID=UPI0037B93382
MTTPPRRAPAVELPDAVRVALAASFRLADSGGVVRVAPVARRGRMAQSARVLVRETDGSLRTVFAKWPSSQGGIRRIARHSGAYRREVMFYRDLAGDCGTSVPRVHFSSYDPRTDAFVLLLQDLTGARPGDDADSSVADVRRTLRTIAHLHARWAADRPGRSPWLPTWHGPRTRRYVRFELDRIARAAAQGRFAHASAGPLLPLLADLGERLGDFFERAVAGRQTLVHGDLHMDQVLLPDDADPVVVDWQLVQRGPIGVDLARLVVMSLPAEQRRRHESDLLHAYGEALAEGGAPACAMGDLLDEYRRGIVWTAFVNTSYSLSCPADSASDERGDVHDVLWDRVVEAADDHGLVQGRP